MTTIEYSVKEIWQIRPDPRNARTHSRKQVSQIAASIAGNGFVNPILINPAGVVIADHGHWPQRSAGAAAVPGG